MYCLGAGATNTVEIAAQSTTVSALVRDKFLITAVTVEQEGVPATKIAEIMKVGFVCRNLFHACFQVPSIQVLEYPVPCTFCKHKLWSFNWGKAIQDIKKSTSNVLKHIRIPNVVQGNPRFCPTKM